MSEANHKQWRFEPHNMFGEIGPDGEPLCAYGYLTVGSLPVFELNVFLEHAPDLLASVARKACAADAMYEALQTLCRNYALHIGPDDELGQLILKQGTDAISRAEGAQ
jgi:hypothetical protein